MSGKSFQPGYRGKVVCEAEDTFCGRRSESFYNHSYFLLVPSQPSYMVELVQILPRRDTGKDITKPIKYTNVEFQK